MWSAVLRLTLLSALGGGRTDSPWVDWLVGSWVNRPVNSPGFSAAAVGSGETPQAGTLDRRPQFGRSPGRTTRNKKLLGAKGIATRN